MAEARASGPRCPAEPLAEELGGVLLATNDAQSAVAATPLEAGPAPMSAAIARHARFASSGCFGARFKS